jgi:hypothetical protein
LQGIDAGRILGRLGVWHLTIHALGRSGIRGFALLCG